MAIIATLASIGIYGIPAIVRQADVTACQGHLKKIYEQMFVYYTNNRGLSMASGPDFVLSIWNNNQVDHTEKDAELFFCPSRKIKPGAGLENVTPEMISYTGPNQTTAKSAMGPQDRNANEKVIVCDRCLGHQATNDQEADELAHAAKGICFLTLGGSTDFIEAKSFGDFPVIGPESTVEKFQRMVPDEQ
jgi:hypothetical protein